MNFGQFWCRDLSVLWWHNWHNVTSFGPNCSTGNLDGIGKHIFPVIFSWIPWRYLRGLLQLGKIVGLIGYCHGLVIALSFVMLCLCLQLDDFKGLVLRLLSIPAWKDPPYSTTYIFGDRMRPPNQVLLPGVANKPKFVKAYIIPRGNTSGLVYITNTIV